MRDEITKKIEPIPRPNHHARLVDRLKQALDEANEIHNSQDIVSAICKLIASTRRRELEHRIDELPDITNEAEVAA